MCAFSQCRLNANGSSALHVSVANKTVDQTNIVGETAVAGANDVAQATVEGVENVAASTGMVSQVSCHGYTFFIGYDT